MRVLWLDCGGTHCHIVAPCPDCFGKQGGLITGTLGTVTGSARVSGRCDACGRQEEFYAEGRDKKVWSLRADDLRSRPAVAPAKPAAQAAAVKPAAAPKHHKKKAKARAG